MGYFLSKGRRWQVPLKYKVTWKTLCHKERHDCISTHVFTQILDFAPIKTRTPTMTLLLKMAVRRLYWLTRTVQYYSFQKDIFSGDAWVYSMKRAHLVVICVSPVIAVLWIRRSTLNRVRKAAREFWNVSIPWTFATGSWNLKSLPYFSLVSFCTIGQGRKIYTNYFRIRLSI